MRAWIRPTALVGRIRSLYSACWKTCVVEKAQAHWVGRWLTVPQEAGRAGPRQAPRLPGSQAATASATAQPPSQGAGVKGEGRPGPF